MTRIKLLSCYNSIAFNLAIRTSCKNQSDSKASSGTTLVHETNYWVSFLYIIVLLTSNDYVCDIFMSRNLIIIFIFWNWTVEVKWPFWSGLQKWLHTAPNLTAKFQYFISERSGKPLGIIVGFCQAVSNAVIAIYN